MELNSFFYNSKGLDVYLYIIIICALTLSATIRIKLKSDGDILWNNSLLGGFFVMATGVLGSAMYYMWVKKNFINDIFSFINLGDNATSFAVWAIIVIVLMYIVFILFPTAYLITRTIIRSKS